MALSKVARVSRNKRYAIPAWTREKTPDPRGLRCACSGPLISLAIAVWVSMAWPLVAAEKSKTIDQQLFEELRDDLFSDLAPIEREKGKAAGEQQPGSLDLELQRELGGEDLGQQTAADPLEHIAESMREVRDRLAARDAAVETQQKQTRIVERFDELIARLKQQQQQQQQQQKSGDNSQSKGQPGDQQQAGSKSGQGQPTAQSNAPARDSTTRLGQAAPSAATADERAQLMQRAWGNLPAAQQQEMQSARPETFLPKYSRLIEEYYKRLAEDPGK